ncbi:hypothetical protein yc1106_03024 [Curvularia clavata]|uniref:Pet127-domain-containing protein n=1 Tax=Curvularia clavata TaxID=95742 RepID=A0A9Q8Z4Y2_CURCL|nr:hypothetical protein yc1106_03024 [Curvularia clavata]
MLSRQLVQASPRHRNPVCLFCAAQSLPRPRPWRPFSATAAVLKRAPVRKVVTPKAGKKSKATAKTRDAEHDEHDDTSGVSLKEALLGRKGLKRETEREKLNISSIQADELEFEPVSAERPPVPMLSYGLDRVLFNPGVYRLQDPRSRVYNFDPYLERIMPAHEFDFDALSEYKTSSKDEDLLALTKKIGAKFTGSTSSMSGILQHFHFLLSGFRGLNHDMLSRQFPDPSPKFSKITLGPSAVFLRYKDGVYAIDADKSFDRPNIMSWLGHSLEKLLTTERSEFERYRRSNPEQAPPEDNSGRCYHYSKQGSIMMRSQLDAIDPRLPGTGVFDLKTRAVVSIRMNHKEFEEGSGYQLRHALGEWESFEREFYDMTRATLLKYSLQARMGRMDGIFIAFHNIERIFGFQYLSLSDMDAVLHGQHDTSLGDQEFKVSIRLVDELLAKATAQFPDTSLRLHFEAREGKTPFMYVFAEPVTEEQADEIQQAGEAAQEEFARTVVGIPEDDRRTQEAWQDIQDDIDKQVGEDQNSVSTGESGEAGSSRESLDESETASEETAEETAEEATQTLEETTEKTNEETTEDAQEGSTESTANVLDPTSTSEKPLLGWTLSVRNLVNGGYVDRPTNFTDQDEWKVEYHIKEIPEQSRWKLYNALKERRRQLIGMDEQETDKKLKHYRDLISRFSRRGRKWRIEQDQLNEEKGVQVYRPLGPGSDAAVNEQTRPDEVFGCEKKEEILDGVPASPS